MILNDEDLGWEGEMAKLRREEKRRGSKSEQELRELGRSACKVKYSTYF